ncbi:uncharacterized protein [Oscarella lobularis]|uniref:uncharacterized protein n=1 Tax=Oscarella lobularis TaxID=121494 RepID=UPI0033133E99
MGYKTIRAGQKALIFNELGEGRVVKGPRRIWLQRTETFQLLKVHIASQAQYLEVRDKEGRVTNHSGPCQMYLNPLEHDSIVTRDAMRLTADEMLVVYKQEDDKIERRLLYGPAMFVPSAHEWLHEFQWHGVDSKDKTRWIPNDHTFRKLSAIPGQMYYNVRDVRTNDDVVMRVKLMLFYELSEPEVMLNITHDPIADFINAVCSDVIAFASQLSYAEFHKQTSFLSKKETYPQLCQRAKRIGYDITQVVYRGYHASENTQHLQDAAIETRTQRRINTEIEGEKAKLASFKLNKELSRTAKRQEIQTAKSEHRQEVEKRMQSVEIEKEQRRHAAQLLRDAKDREELMKLEAEAKRQELGFLFQLKELGVDLTHYLVNQNPTKISEELQIVKEE